MAILVDPARWPWRDRLWCHLVSDTSLEELHEFAAQIGCRRVAFQGDHYDIEAADRTLALTLGAHACSSRELVSRLRVAGLRLAPGAYEKWTLAASKSRPLTISELAAHNVPDRLAGPLREPNVRRLVDRADGWLYLRRSAAAAIVIHGRSAEVADRIRSEALVADPHPDASLYVRVDQRHGWSVELIDPAPTAHQ